MAQFLSTALFLATLIAALATIAAMLRGHADAILHALAGRSLKAAALEENYALGAVNFVSVAPRRIRNVTMPRRPAPLRVAA
ncbi:hypothetical protein [Sphingomonas cavernae]|nr:hypothetical protein [Sphingomonas cavernae]